MHRDLKPQNIFLTQDKKLKLGDFGTNKIFDKFKIGTENTFQNLPPEMCHLEDNKKLGDKFDKSGDVWALGVILYQLMTDKLPFYG